MKKLVLLVSVFLLLTGMVFADVTFAPAVTGSANVIWGMDLMPEGQGSTAVNSGFTADNSATLDLGVTVDPFDAKTGEDGMYGEIELTGMGVTAKSGSDVAVTAPTVTAKLYFMDGLYMRVCTNPSPQYDLVSPFGELIDIDGEKQKGSWYDSDGTNDTGTTVEADYGDAGYGFTYEMDALTVNADFVSQDDWGKDGDTTAFDLEDFDADEDGWLTGAEVIVLDAAVAAVTATDNSYEVAYGGSSTTFTEVYTNDDDEIALIETDSDGENEVVYEIDNNTDSVETSLYTMGLDVTYELDGIGTFMAYVLPIHASEWDTFAKWGYGGKATIDAVDMVTPMVAADLMYNENAGDGTGNKVNTLEWEAYVELPVSYEVSEDMSFDVTAKMAATDSETNKDGSERIVYDGYFMAGADVMGASINAAYMMSEMFYPDETSSSMTFDASYGLDAMGGTITPSVAYGVDFGASDVANDEDGFLTVAVAAEVVDNTTFTLKYVTGDILVAAPDTEDLGVVTFTTCIAY